MQLLRARLFDARVGLQQQADAALRAYGFLRGRKRRLAGNGDRQHDAGKQHGVAHGKNDQDVFAHAASLFRRRYRQP